MPGSDIPVAAAKPPFQLVEDSPLANLMAADKALKAAADRVSFVSGVVYGTVQGVVIVGNNRWQPEYAREVALAILKLLGEDD